MSQELESVQKDRLAAIALGGNCPSPAGAPAETLQAAISALTGSDSGESVRLVAASRFFRTPAWPPGSGDDFVNAVILVRTAASPAALLDRLHRIEAHFGRQRRERWGPRGLDLDLLFVGDIILPSRAGFERWRRLAPERQRSEAPEGLVLPHPRLQDRAFVLIPLADVAPGWVHPVIGRDVDTMLAGLPAEAKAGILPI